MLQFEDGLASRGGRLPFIAGGCAGGAPPSFSSRQDGHWKSREVGPKTDATVPESFKTIPSTAVYCCLDGVGKAAWTTCLEGGNRSGCGEAMPIRHPFC